MSLSIRCNLLLTRIIPIIPPHDVPHYVAFLRLPVCYRQGKCVLWAPLLSYLAKNPNHPPLAELTLLLSRGPFAFHFDIQLGPKFSKLIESGNYHTALGIILCHQLPGPLEIPIK